MCQKLDLDSIFDHCARMKGNGYMIKKLKEVRLFLKMCCDTSVLGFVLQELPLQDVNAKPEESRILQSNSNSSAVLME